MILSARHPRHARWRPARLLLRFRCPRNGLSGLGARPDKNSPAGQIADRHFCVDYDDYAAPRRLAAGCAAITTEFENVPADTAGLPGQVRAGASCMRRRRWPLPEPHRRKPSCATTVLPHGPFAASRRRRHPPRRPHLPRPSSRSPALATTARARASPTAEEALIALAAFKGEPACSNSA